MVPDRAVIYWDLEYTSTDGKRWRYDQLALQRWENGQIVECHVPNRLNAHDAEQGPGLLVAPEHDALIEFPLEVLPGHVRFRPAARGDDSFVRLRAIVDDGPDRLKIAIVAAPNHVARELRA